MPWLGKESPTSAEPRRRKPDEAYKVCDSCGAHAAPGASTCSGCGKERFAPEWVLELRRVNRNFSVQISKPQPGASQTDPKLTLYKWWPGGRATFNINTAAQWDRVRAIVDTELAPYLGWSSRQELERAVSEAAEQEQGVERRVRELAGRDPNLIARVLEGISFEGVDDEDLPSLTTAVGEIAAVLATVEGGFRSSINRLIGQLPQQGKQGVEQLAQLLDSLTLTQIASVTAEVQRRAGLLQTFRERALDERTYEITGEGSIHRLLEGAMWIVDERYWLMHSNSTLRTIVGDKIAGFKNRKRPDFVCGTVDRKLIIIELKRPSHSLGVADLNQLEEYVDICNQHDSDLSGFEAILVGPKPTDELSRRMKLRRSDFKVRTYAQLIDDCERRYKRYLDGLQGVEGPATSPSRASARSRSRKPTAKGRRAGKAPR